MILGQVWYTFAHLIVIWISTILRANIFSLIYGITWFIAVPFFPHEKLPQRKTIAKVLTTVQLVSSATTLTGQIIIQILYATSVGDTITHQMAINEWERLIFEYLGWLSFDGTLQTLQLLFPDILVFVSSAFMCISVFYSQKKYAEFFSFEKKRTKKKTGVAQSFSNFDLHTIFSHLALVFIMIGGCAYSSILTFPLFGFFLITLLYISFSVHGFRHFLFQLYFPLWPLVYLFLICALSI